MNLHQLAPSASVISPDTTSDAGWMLRALDSQALLDEVRSVWSDPDEEITSLACERFFPSAKGSPVMVYTAQMENASGGRQVRLFAVHAQGRATAMREEIAASLRKSRRAQVQKGDQLHQLIALPRLDMVLRPAGLDEKIDGLGLLQAPERVAEGWTSAELLVHRLHKRAVLRLHNADSSERIIVKVFRNHSDQHVRLERISRFLQSSAFDCSSSVGVPSIRNGLPEGVSGLVFEDVGATELGQLAGADLFDGCRIAGQSAGRLHRLPLRLREEHGPEQECALLTGWCEVASAAWPDYAGLLCFCLGDAIRRLRSVDEFSPSLIHRDLHEKQLLVNGTQAWLIDFDTFAMGDPAQDIGNFIAHLRWAGLFDARIRPVLCEAFLEGYSQSNSAASSRNIDAHLYASLLRIACIHSFNEQRRDMALRLLQELVAQ